MIIIFVIENLKTNDVRDYQWSFIDMSGKALYRSYGQIENEI